jgi:hypothetical protein
MDEQEFLGSLKDDSPPQDLSLALTALWWDAKGDWNKAHEHAQKDDGNAGAWVHAYLHRKEGDVANAGYWYSQARKRPSRTTSESEWREIVDALLEEN